MKKPVSGYGWNGAEITVNYEGGYVEVKIETPVGSAIIRFDPDIARRFFRDVHEELGDP